MQGELHCSTCTWCLKASDRFEMLAEQKFQMRWARWGSCKIKAFFCHITEEGKSNNRVLFWGGFSPSIAELTVLLLHEAKLISSFICFLVWWFLFQSWFLVTLDSSLLNGFEDSKVNLYVFKQC